MLCRKQSGLVGHTLLYTERETNTHPTLTLTSAMLTPIRLTLDGVRLRPTPNQRTSQQLTAVVGRQHRAETRPGRYPEHRHSPASALTAPSNRCPVRQVSQCGAGRPHRTALRRPLCPLTSTPNAAHVVAQYCSRCTPKRLTLTPKESHASTCKPLSALRNSVCTQMRETLWGSR